MFGWFHMHPFDGNFLSSADQHTTYSLIEQGVENPIAVVVDGRDYSPDVLFDAKHPRVKCWFLSETGKKAVARCNASEDQREENENDFHPLPFLHSGHPHNHALIAKDVHIIDKPDNLVLVVEEMRHGNAAIDLFETHQQAMKDVIGTEAEEDDQPQESIDLTPNPLNLDPSVDIPTGMHSAHVFFRLSSLLPHAQRFSVFLRWCSSFRRFCPSSRRTCPSFRRACPHRITILCKSNNRYRCAVATQQSWTSSYSHRISRQRDGT
jgi:hypothetical protein